MRTRIRRRRISGDCPGVTLVELLVVLVLLAMLAGIAGLTLRTAHPVPNVTPARAWIAALQDSAARSGHTVSGTFLIEGGASLRQRQMTYATAYPDGRVIADSGFGVDPLTGFPNDAGPQSSTRAEP